MIPALVDGVLPDGVHECTMDEVDEAFGRFWKSDRRIQLTKKLRAFVDEARKSGIVAALIIDGSYVTAKEEPGDIDLVIALSPDLEVGRELRPFQYNVRSRRMVRQVYKFDAVAYPDGSEEFNKALTFFGRIRVDDPDMRTSQRRKGLLRITL